jgi:hypothetical protein
MRQKFRTTFADVNGQAGFDRVFDQRSTTGVCRLGQGVHRGSWARFSGDDPGWPRFDRGLTSLTRLIRSLALMTVIKNLGRHTCPKAD